MQKYIGFTDDYRMLSDNEILYQLTGSRDMAASLGNAEQWEDILQKLSPARKAMAKAVIEMYHRLQAKAKNVKKITQSKDAFELVYPYFYALSVEECWVVALSQSGKVLKKFRVSVGGIASTIVDVRVVMAALLQVKAVSFILVHNHPSGNSKPSREDDRLTESCRQAGQLLNIRLLDHLIVADDTFYSYGDEGRL